MKRAPHETWVFKVCPAPEWAAAEAAGHYTGSADDHRDGFIHLSTAAQLEGTLAKHFAGETDLVLLAVPVSALKALKFEPSRGGALFPHLYGALPVSAAIWHVPLAIGADGRHVLPDLPT